MTQLRKWQVEALETYRTKNSRDFLLVATPGAGKTTFALTVARKLMNVGAVTSIIIVAPTDHLRNQWADAAIEFNIFIDSTLKNSEGLLNDEYDGYVCTYAQVASAPAVHAKRANLNPSRTLVIFDEIHHAGDGQTWGEAVKVSFEGVSRRLCLTGTPFRTSDASAIPFIKYEPSRDDDKLLECKPDYEYGYKHALKDGVVRPVTFAAYSGISTWTNSAGEAFSASLSNEDDDNGELERQAWLTALNPRGQWLPNVIGAADKRLERIKVYKPEAAGMILASDQDSAKAYAKILKAVTGKTATLVLSEDSKASDKISYFKDSKDPKDDWLVAVRMVSEGVDVPRLAVGVWATNYRTPLFFAQAIGRFVRIQNKHEIATIFIPAVKPILALASDMEYERRHVLSPQQEKELEEGSFEITEDEDDERNYDLNKINPIDSEAEFTAVIQDGKFVPIYEFDGLTEAEQNFLGFTGILNEQQAKGLLSQYRKKHPRADAAPKEKGKSKWVSPKERLQLRRDISKLVNKIAARTAKTHAEIHKALISSIPGPPSPKANPNTLHKRIEWLENNS